MVLIKCNAQMSMHVEKQQLEFDKLKMQQVESDKLKMKQVESEVKNV